MRSPGFQRFVAIFVGILLVLDIALAIYLGDEGLLSSAALLAGVYAIYMFIFLRKEKERKSQGKTDRKKDPDSPLLRR